MRHFFIGGPIPYDDVRLQNRPREAMRATQLGDGTRKNALYYKWMLPSFVCVST